MGRAEDVEGQRQILKTYRDMLAILLAQIAIAGEADAAQAKLYERDHARADIARIKAALRGWWEIVMTTQMTLPPPRHPCQTLRPPRLDLRRRSISRAGRCKGM